MARFGQRCAWAGALIGALAASHSASARSEIQPFRVQYHAPKSCAGVEALLWQMQARTQKLRPAEPDEPALGLEVQIRKRAKGVRGTLVVREADGRRTVRKFPGEDCGEVIDAIALAIAVMVDPDALTAPLLALRSGRAPSISPPPPRPPMLALAPALTVQTGPAPEAMLGYAAHVQVLPPLERTFAPALVVSFHHARSDVLTTPSGNAELVWTSARVHGCPWRWPADTIVGFRPCLSLDVGVLEGVGFATLRADARTAPWLALGGALRWELLLGEYAILGADGGASVPIVRSRFYFAQSGTVHQVPWVGLSAGIHAGLRFP